ncbi:MAG: hypothetical protein KAI86_16990, partial [Desulfobacterales bacterium]|nr:hypothetical protein [Desulfobacterales bacterium]
GTGGVSYGSITSPTDLGSGGGEVSLGGAGGGAVKLTVTGTVTVNGLITANGANGGATGSGTDRSGGGGAGGSIWITSGIFTGSGSITANGGAGNSYGYDGGGGSGGRIAVYYTTDSSAVIYRTYGGSLGGRFGGAGTIYTKAAVAANGDLLIDNNDQNSLSDTYIGKTLINETITFDTITIQNYGHLETDSSTNITYTTLDWSTRGTITDMGGTFDLLSGGGALLVPETSRLYAYTTRTHSSYTIDGWVKTRQAITTAGDFNIGAVGILTHEYNTSIQQYVIDITAANLTIASGGTINVNAIGYTRTHGPGAGNVSIGGGGAGHGGEGGDGYSGTGGVSYG